MKVSGWLSSALAVVVLGFGVVPALAQDAPERPERPIVQPSPEQVAERAQARVEAIVKRSLAAIERTERRTVALVERLQEEGRDALAVKAAREGAAAIKKQTRAAQARIRAVCVASLRLLDGHPLSAKVKAVCERGAEAVGTSARESLGAIREAVKPSDDPSVG
ncbi:hypothetical protein [Mucisphaera sp.]|uniref:hypothetical protein n=1 Tax=Mucisphaera sp. TaxID=2913024 RepID=UPI003D10552D